MTVTVVDGDKKKKLKMKPSKEVEVESEEEEEEAAAARAERKAAKKAAKKEARKAREAEEASAASVEAEEGDEKAAKQARKEAKRKAKEEEAGQGGGDGEVSDKKAGKKRKQSEEGAEEGEGAEEQEKKKKKKKKKGADGGEEASAASPSAGGSDDEESAYRESLGLSISGGSGSFPPCVRKLADAPFDKKVVGAMTAAGFTEPSTIQAQAWPAAMQGSDIVAVAKTGSGKTLGFLLPAFDRIVNHGDGGKDPQALVLAPTRELAVQIEAECAKFAKIQGVSSVCVYGGVPSGPQKAALAKGSSVVIGTPGRLCDLLKQGSLALGGCKYVVLDEADRMLDMGFEPQVTEIFGVLPGLGAGGRQTLLFSATWPKAVRKMASKLMRQDPYLIFAQGGEDAELNANKAVSQRFIQATDDEKDKKLWDVLQELPPKARVVIFANTKRRVDYLCNALWDEGLGTCSIHGDKQQSERDKALASFVQGERPLLMATDVAARGLDIKGVTHVINFDMARDVESYIHRIGRTGRAGELGAAITFWNPDYDKECTPALAKIARDANQEVPDWLAKFEKSKANKQWKVADAVLA